MRVLGCAWFMLSLLPATAAAQVAPPRAADSALVLQVLSAEDRRDPRDAALQRALASGDERVRSISWRAIQRIRDPRFAARDSLPAVRSAVAWPEPPWRQRYRALAARKDDCTALRAALTDSAWQVRLRAADLVSGACGSDSAMVAELRRWVDERPADVSSRPAGGVSWHAAAHALVALARASPAAARERLPRMARDGEWHLRLYAARAAAALGDTALLRVLAGDANDNVKEAAIDALSAAVGHADDDVYLAALHAAGAQAVRAAAAALKGSPRADATDSASAAYARWLRHDVDSERDARVALLEAAGLPVADHLPAPNARPPGDAVALAFGRDTRLRVTMSDASGGGSFVLRLRGDVAPIMAARVLDLVRSRYYDGGNWHRVEPDFVIQGGGPGTNEYVGFARYFRDELGTLPHARGTVGMSTRGHDTGDAQWFVNLRDNPRLTADYTVFAEVVQGMDVVDGILEGDVVASVRELPPP